MVRKQNERTLILQYRIIPLSLLPTSFLSYFSTPRPLSTRLGAFFFPETFSHKFFPKFFPIRPGRLFLYFGAKNYGFLRRTFFYFFGAKNYEGRRRWALPKWGGYPFLHAFHIANRHLFASGKFPSPAASLPSSWHISSLNRSKTGQK